MNDTYGPTSDDPRVDKQGAELDRQRFQMLRDIADELSGKAVFPTNFESAMRLRRALEDENLSIKSAVALIAVDPLVSARVVALANSAFYSQTPGEILDLQRAVERVGLAAVRSTALAIAMKQLALTRQIAAFQGLVERLWMHSLRSASAAYVIAKRLTDINPDEAMLAGMIHDIGGFYMIYRATQYEELVLRPDTTRHLVVRWHESIGHSLAVALGLPYEIADALPDHDQVRPFPDPPQTLAEVVYLANLLAGGRFEWLEDANVLAERDVFKLTSLSQALVDDILLHETSLKGALADA